MAGSWHMKPDNHLAEDAGAGRDFSAMHKHIAVSVVLRLAFFHHEGRGARKQIQYKASQPLNLNPKSTGYTFRSKQTCKTCSLSGCTDMLANPHGLKPACVILRRDTCDPSEVNQQTHRRTPGVDPGSSSGMNKVMASESFGK